MVQCIQLIFQFHSPTTKQHFDFWKKSSKYEKMRLYTSAGQSHKRKLYFKQDILGLKSTSKKLAFQSNFKFQDDNISKIFGLPVASINVILQSTQLSNAETPKYWVGLSNPRHGNTGLVSCCGVSLSSCRHSSDCTTIKIPSGGRYGLFLVVWIYLKSLDLICHN